MGVRMVTLHDQLLDGPEPCSRLAARVVDADCLRQRRISGAQLGAATGDRRADGARGRARTIVRQFLTEVLLSVIGALSGGGAAGLLAPWR